MKHQADIQGQAMSAIENGDVNYCDRNGAQLLKDKIEEYWRERGHEVVIWLDDNGFHAALRTIRYDVRSNMINGMPRPPGMPTPRRCDKNGHDGDEAGDE